ncbi:MAG: NAD(P)H-hydrate dehydratase [Elusimicrobia bacterium GWA2_61_42]|nr:MAG: NAD(P)H-hydrate dehydratase [Elusimicrobia bacterium GWA2_61_42]OGR78717.1 MAG: NAD(P)H-hydrate dehydratase [Elusimicrobia bacterium GWC2_61_25]
MKILRITPAFLRPLLPARRKDSHKGDYGRVLVAGGSRGMAGAAILAARAALKSGAGLVTVACPESERQTIARALPEAMTFGGACSGGAFTAAAAAQVAAFARQKKIDVLLVGPGLGASPGARAFVLRLLDILNIPAVVDADALNAIAAGPRPFRPRTAPSIFTPHPGEAERLLGKKAADRPAAAAALAAGTGGIAVLKGAGTLVCDGKTILKNGTGGPALAKGGSGDVLGGLAAGFFAQAGLAKSFTRETARSSAALAVFLHGLCGDLAKKKFTERCVLAGELLDFLPAAIRRVKR